MSAVLRRARRAAGHWAFDGRLGVRTSAVVPLEELGLAATDREFYAPAGWLTLERVLPRRSVSRDDVFLDLGSGMGRMVLLAARYPFARVIGVELSEELNEIARRNVDRIRGRMRCQDVELVTADVMRYDIPSDVTVAFLNNPFRGEIFASVLDRLIASVDRNPRRLRVIYRAPREEALLEASARCRLLKQRGFMGNPDKRIVMYEISPVA